MRVKLECEKCGASGEAHVIGSWDIKNVVHYCGPRQLGIPSVDGRALKPGEFRFIFDAPRRAF